MSKAPKIGIVSGVGPLAGSHIFAKTLQYASTAYGAVEDHEYPDVVLLNHGIEGVDSTASLSDGFEKEIVGMANTVQDYGATIFGIACNTAHLYLDKISIVDDANLLNLIDLVAKKAAKTNLHYLLLTSQASKQQKLYHQYLEKYGVMFEETSASQQKLLDKVIGLVMAHKLKAAGELITELLQAARVAGCTAVIAGCTELPIAISHAEINSEMYVVDSNQILAEALVDEYYMACQASSPKKCKDKVK